MLGSWAAYMVLAAGPIGVSISIAFIVIGGIVGLFIQGIGALIGVGIGGIIGVVFFNILFIILMIRADTQSKKGIIIPPVTVGIIISLSAIIGKYVFGINAIIGAGICSIVLISISVLFVLLELLSKK
jgi:hypothetical protein